MSLNSHVHISQSGDKIMFTKNQTATQSVFEDEIMIEFDRFIASSLQYILRMYVRRRVRAIICEISVNYIWKDKL